MNHNPVTSEIFVEGLHEGNYRLLVLGVRGDEKKDFAEISLLEKAADIWLRFPADLQKPLEAEYFYSQTPFTVLMRQTETGSQEVVEIRKEVPLRRIIGRADFSFSYNNPYVRNAVVGKKVSFS